MNDLAFQLFFLLAPPLGIFAAIWLARWVNQGRVRKTWEAR